MGGLGAGALAYVLPAIGAGGGGLLGASVRASACGAIGDWFGVWVFTAKGFYHRLVVSSSASHAGGTAWAER